MAGSRYLNAYKKNGLETDLAVADGHRVIQLLYQGLVDCIVRAKAAIEARDIEAKATQINKALNIVGGLETAVQFDPNNPEQNNIANTLKTMYAIFNDRLLRASATLKTEPLDEIYTYAMQIKTAWDNIPESEKLKGFAMQEARAREKGMESE